MTHKEQNKILDAKIESNVNQYKVDRMNAEISAFSSGDLNKYEFLKRIDLNYKPNALDKARFEFSPLGQTFSTGLDKNAQGYQEEGVIKLLKDIRDGLRGINRRSNDNRRNDEFDNMSDDSSFDDNSSFDDDGSFDDNDNGSDLNRKYNRLLLKHFQLRKNINDTSKELDKTKDELDKTKDELHYSHYFNIDGKHNGFDINGFHKDTRSKYDSNGFDINGRHKARSFEDQKGKGYVDLPILLSKIYTNNNTVEPSSKELISNVKQLINDL